MLLLRVGLSPNAPPAGNAPPPKTENQKPSEKPWAGCRARLLPPSRPIPRLRLHALVVLLVQPEAHVHTPRLTLSSHLSVRLSGPPVCGLPAAYAPSLLSGHSGSR